MREFTQITAPEIEGWGKVTDPDGDCRFFLSRKTLLINVPAAETPHDFSPELKSVNAPRVLQSITADFDYQVRVEDRFVLSDESTQPGRFGYHGAGLLAMADAQNAVTFVRGVVKQPGKDSFSYANFEFRIGGVVQRIGETVDLPLPKTGPVFLRLARRGQQIFGSVSTDGKDWKVVGTEDLPADWAPELQVGVDVINTTKEDYSPQFSRLQMTK